MNVSKFKVFHNDILLRMIIHNNNLLFSYSWTAFWNLLFPISLLSFFLSFSTFQSIRVSQQFGSSRCFYWGCEGDNASSSDTLWMLFIRFASFAWCTALESMFFTSTWHCLILAIPAKFKPVKLCLKIDLVSYPAWVEGLVNMV